MLDFFIKDFNQSHGFEAKNGQIIDSVFFMWPFLVMCGTMGYLFHVWGGVGVGTFFFFFLFFCDKYLY